MREAFNDLTDLLGYYQFLKMDVSSMATIMPGREGDPQKYRAFLQRSNVEDKFTFITDIEKFVNAYYIKQVAKHPKYSVVVPLECLMLIFYLKFCMNLSRFNSYGELANHFRMRIDKKKEKLPRRLKYRENICDIAQGMKEEIVPYFVSKRYLPVPVYNDFSACKC